MISKELLTALVFVSLTQGSAFAQEITPGTYTDFIEVINTDKKPVIQAPGEYVFHGGLHIDNEFGSTQSHTAVISNGTGSGNVMTITADSGDNKGTLHISSNSDETPGNWIGTKNDIIQINSSNRTNINLTNTDLILDGENYDTAIRMDESIKEPNKARLNIQGDGKSDLLISGGMIGGIDAWFNAAVNIKDIDTFCISKNTALDTTQLVGIANINAIRAKTNSMVTINANDFSITGDKDDKNKIVFYAGIATGGTPTSNSTLNFTVKNQFNIDSVYYGISNYSCVNIEAGDINIYAKALFNDEKDYYSLGEAVYSDGYLRLHAVNNINLISELSGLDLGTSGVSRPGPYIDKKGNAEVIAETGALNIIGEKSVGVISLIQDKQQDIRKVLLQANGAINIYGGDKGIFYEPGSRQMDIISDNNDINITSENIAFYAADKLRKEDIGRNPSVKADYTRGTVKIKALEGG